MPIGAYPFGGRARGGRLQAPPVLRELPCQMHQPSEDIDRSRAPKYRYAILELTYLPLLALNAVRIPAVFHPCGPGSSSSRSLFILGAGRNTVSRFFTLPFPFSFCANGFQHSEQISYSLPQFPFADNLLFRRRDRK